MRGYPTTHQIITKDPIENLSLLLDAQKGDAVRGDLRDLVRACNIHQCNNYCTRNGTTACKSGFPHRLRESGAS